jgi:predicted phage-related endonuclease
VDVVPGSPEWLAVRREGVTATDIVTVCGLSAWDSPYSLYWQKRGIIPEAQDSDRFRLGRDLESPILDRWHEKNPLFTSRHGGLYRSEERLYQTATPDQIVWSHAEPISQPLELKSWADTDRHAWDDGPPAKVRAQVLWQMDTLDVSTGHVGVLFLPSGEFCSYVIEHDFSVIPDGPEVDDPCDVCKDIKLLREAGWRFFQQMHGHMPPPDVDGSAATMAAVKARFGTVDKTATAILAPEAWSIYADAAERADYWTEVKKAAEASLREVTQDAYKLEVDGQVVALRIKFEAQVKAHTRSVDMIRRTPRKKEASE